MMTERYELAVERIGRIIEEETVAETYRPYFQKTAKFVGMLCELKEELESGVTGNLRFRNFRKETVGCMKIFCLKIMMRATLIRLMP